jgi:hypothetical protein
VPDVKDKNAIACAPVNILADSNRLDERRKRVANVLAYNKIGKIIEVGRLAI